MQKVAAYLLERRSGVESHALRHAEEVRCVEVLCSWLRKDKLANVPESLRGTYRTERGAEGVYHWEQASEGERSWRLLRLVETEPDGVRYCTSVSVTNTGTKIVIYVSIEAGLNLSSVKPIRVEPRCPRVVRYFLEQPGEWYHGESKICKLQFFKGVNAGEELAALIIEQTRSLPIIAVSQDENGLALAGLDTQLAYDLEAVANTFTIDGHASWGLTYSLGKRFSCYWGAVRIYWPNFSQQDDSFSHPNWTAERLSSFSNDAKTTAGLFRNQLRQLLLQTSALSVLRPNEIDDIQSSAKASHLGSLMQQAHSGVEFEELAKLYAKDNDILGNDNQDLKRQIRELNEKFDATGRRFTNNDMSQLSQLDQSHPHIAPSGPLDADAERPKSGEIRFYKCIDHKPKYDVMAVVLDCNRNCWQPEKKAEKAKKGIHRLEERNDWRSMQHCG